MGWPKLNEVLGRIGLLKILITITCRNDWVAEHWTFRLHVVGSNPSEGAKDLILDFSVGDALISTTGNLFTDRKRSLRRLCFHRCLSVHGGVYPIACWDTHTPDQRQIPPWEQTPPWRRHLPLAMHAGRYCQQADGTHPTGMHSCFIFFFWILENFLSKNWTYLVVIGGKFVVFFNYGFNACVWCVDGFTKVVERFVERLSLCFWRQCIGLWRPWRHWFLNSNLWSSRVRHCRLSVVLLWT